MMPNLARTRGFTLIELMVVVVIVGILAGVAYPSFREQSRRSARAEARAALLDGASRQEQYWLDNKSYTATLSDLQIAATTESEKYAISVDAASAGCPIARCYSLRATPQGPQAEDANCSALTLNSSGVKSATGTTPTECW